MTDINYINVTDINYMKSNKYKQHKGVTDINDIKDNWSGITRNS